MNPLDLILRRVIHRGHLALVLPDGEVLRYGDGTGRPLILRLHDRRAGWRIMANPHLGLGEAYMDGQFSLEGGDIYDFLDMALGNIGMNGVGGFWPRLRQAWRMATRRWQQYNPTSRARRNVAHHYDLSDRLYDLFLDADRQYSCAYFMAADDSLERAQAQKKRHLAAKLAIMPGQKILDIGSGWGGLGLYLANLAPDLDVTGLTLSEEQHRVSNARAQQAHLEARLRYKLQDYRQEKGRYDRIVSVGMFEHVGVNHYRCYFETIRDALAEDGVALLHSIGRSDGPGVTNPWVQKYIFPGGYVPALSEVLPIIESVGLYITDIEILRLHYAETLRHWRARFNAHRREIAALYDERFCRMWEFYLAGSEATFRHSGHMVFQIQMAKQPTALPLTRDYMIDAERQLPLALTPLAPPRAAAQ